MRGKGGTDIVERPLLLVVDLRVPEGLELLDRRRRRHLRSGEIAFLEGLGPGLIRVSLAVCRCSYLSVSAFLLEHPMLIGPGYYWAVWSDSSSDTGICYLLPN